MHILVTGGAGFIGSNFTRYWLDEHSDDSVTVLDALTYAGNQESLPADERLTFVHGDIGDTALVRDLIESRGVDTVVNFAAESHNSYAIVNPGQFFATNVLGTQGLLEACRDTPLTRFHHVSTCEVYGDLPLDATEIFTEESPYRPRTPYNASKAGGDHAVRAYFETFGVPISITNCANNYGPFQFPEKVLPLFISRALDDKPLPVYQSSENRREWIHVLDHCRAIDLVLARGRVGETYHVGTGEERSVNQLATLILRYFDKPASMTETVPDRPGHDRRYVLDCSKIRSELGWAPQVAFEDGIEDTMRWYADNRAWWEPLLSRAPVREESAWSGR